MGQFASIDHRIAGIAATQGGHVHRDQLAELGLNASAIHHRVKRGLLIAVFKNVYAVGHLPSHPYDRSRGALLAAGLRSALTHDSAASYYGIWKRWRYPLHVVVPTDRRLGGVIIHRNKRLLRSDIIEPEPGLRVTSPAVTVLDMAPRLSVKRLRRVVNEIRLGHRLSLESLEATLDRFPRHPGVSCLRPIVQTSQREPNRSGWEDEWPGFADRHRLPSYVMNHRVCGQRVDVMFVDEGVVVELDGWDSHRTHEAFIHDRRRDAVILAETGMPTVRITHERFHSQAAEEAARLHAILRRRGAEPDQLTG